MDFDVITLLFLVILVSVMVKNILQLSLGENVTGTIRDTETVISHWRITEIN